MYRSPFAYSKQGFGRSVSSPSIQKQSQVGHKSPLTADRFVSGTKSPIRSRSPLREQSNAPMDFGRSKSPIRQSPMKSPLKSPSTPKRYPKPIAEDNTLDAPGVPQDDYPSKLIDISEDGFLAVALNNRVFVKKIESIDEERERIRRRKPEPDAFEVEIDEDNEETIDAVCWTKFGLVVSRNGTIELWDTLSNQIIETIIEDDSCVCTVMSAKGRKLATGWTNGIVRIINLENGGTLTSDNRMRQITSIAWNPDGTMLASGDSRGKVFVMSSNGSREYRLGAQINGITWSDDNSLFISDQSDDGVVRLIRISNSKERDGIRETFTGFPVSGLSWNEKWGLCVAHKGQNPNYWEFFSKELVKISQFSGHADDVIYVTSSPDCDTVVTIGKDETLRLWRITDPQSKPGLSPSVKRSPSPFGSSPYLR